MNKCIGCGETLQYEDINKTFGVDWRRKYEHSKNSKVNI